MVSLVLKVILPLEAPTAAASKRTVNESLEPGLMEALSGSVIASKFQLGGNPLVNFPSSSDAASDYGAWFGFKDAWTEVSGL